MAKSGLSKVELKHIIAALEIAMMSEESFIDAHRTRWFRGRRVVPEDDRDLIRQTKNRIAYWRALRKKFGDELDVKGARERGKGNDE